jgi:WD40 repeat protein
MIVGGNLLRSSGYNLLMDKHRWFVILLILMLASCTRVQAPVSSSTPSIVIKNPTLLPAGPTPIPTKTATVTVTPTLTITSTNTPTITPTFTPSPIPTLSANWLPLPFKKITINNTDKIKFQKIVGVGGYTSLSSDGKFLAMATTHVDLYDFQTLKEIRLEKDPKSSGLKESITAIGFSPDSKLLAVTYVSQWDGGFRIYRTSDGSLQFSLNEGFAWLYSLKFSPDGSMIVLGESGGEIILFDLNEYKATKFWEAHTWIIEDFAFSPDGKQLASVSRDNTFMIWDYPSGKKLFEAKGQEPSQDEMWYSGVKFVAFSTDGTTIVTGSGFGFVEIWKVVENPYKVERVKFWRVDSEPIDSLALSQDNQLLITSTYNGTQLWTMPDGSLLRTLRKVHCDYLSLDETLLVCGNEFWGINH